jgi:hypothetical protein
MSEKDLNLHSSRVPESACPHCGVLFDAATGYAEQPRTGSMAVCAKCGEINQFDDALRLVKADPMDALSYQLDPGPAGEFVRAAQTMVAQRRILAGPIIVVVPTSGDAR